MTVSLTKATDLCSTCGAACRPEASIYSDPSCTACLFDRNAEENFLPLPGLHDLALLLAEPAMTMPGAWGRDSAMTGQYDDYDYYSDLR